MSIIGSPNDLIERIFQKTNHNRGIPIPKNGVNGVIGIMQNVFSATTKENGVNAAVIWDCGREEAAHIAQWMCQDFLKIYSSTVDAARRKLAYWITNICCDTVPGILLAAATDSKGRCICFHIGKGTILCNDDNGTELELVSPPETDFSSFQIGIIPRIIFYRWSTCTNNCIILTTSNLFPLQEEGSTITANALSEISSSNHCMAILDSYCNISDKLIQCNYHSNEGA